MTITRDEHAFIIQTLMRTLDYLAATAPDIGEPSEAQVVYRWSETCLKILARKPLDREPLTNK